MKDRESVEVKDEPLIIRMHFAESYQEPPGDVTLIRDLSNHESSGIELYTKE